MIILIVVTKHDSINADRTAVTTLDLYKTIRDATQDKISFVQNDQSDVTGSKVFYINALLVNKYVNKMDCSVSRELIRES